MTTHPGSRTRALYLWESEDLKRRCGVRQLGLIEARWIANRFSLRYGRRERWATWWQSPHIEVRDVKADPCAYGRSLVVLTRQDSLNVTLLHELVHIRGFGSHANPHSCGFVLKYCDVLSWWFGWDQEELLLLAHQQGLI